MFYSKPSQYLHGIGIHSRSRNILPETNIAPENKSPQWKVVFQPSIFRGYVSFRECNHYKNIPFKKKNTHTQPSQPFPTPHNRRLWHPPRRDVSTTPSTFFGGEKKAVGTKWRPTGPTSCKWGCNPYINGLINEFPWGEQNPTYKGL